MLYIQYTYRIDYVENTVTTAYQLFLLNNYIYRNIPYEYNASFSEIIILCYT